MKKLVSILLLFTFGLSSCEKDDICDSNTPTTPRLVVTFYDVANPTKTKDVTNLKVIGEGMEEGIVFNENGTEITKYLTNGSTVSLPLKVNDSTVTYKFIFDSENTDPASINTDILKIDYTSQNVYVSRACGFKTIFDLTDPGFVRTDDEDADSIWMTEVVLQNPHIESEDETHIKVYF